MGSASWPVTLTGAVAGFTCPNHSASPASCLSHLQAVAGHRVLACPCVRQQTCGRGHCSSWPACWGPAAGSQPGRRCGSQPTSLSTPIICEAHHSPALPASVAFKLLEFSGEKFLLCKPRIWLLECLLLPSSYSSWQHVPDRDIL